AAARRAVGGARRRTPRRRGARRRRTPRGEDAPTARARLNVTHYRAAPMLDRVLARDSLFEHSRKGATRHALSPARTLPSNVRSDDDDDDDPREPAGWPTGRRRGGASPIASAASPSRSHHEQRSLGTSSYGGGRDARR